MKNLIGQVMTLDELCNTTGCNIELISEADVVSGKQTNIDNYNGSNGYGYNFDFELVETGNLYLHEFVVRVTDVQKI